MITLLPLRLIVLSLAYIYGQILLTPIIGFSRGVPLLICSYALDATGAQSGFRYGRSAEEVGKESVAGNDKVAGNWAPIQTPCKSERLARAPGCSIAGCPSYSYGLLGFGRSVPGRLVGVYCLSVEAEFGQGGRVGQGGLSVGDLDGFSTPGDGRD